VSSIDVRNTHFIESRQDMEFQALGVAGKRPWLHALADELPPMACVFLMVLVAGTRGSIDGELPAQPCREICRHRPSAQRSSSAARRLHPANPRHISRDVYAHKPSVTAFVLDEAIGRTHRLRNATLVALIARHGIGSPRAPRSRNDLAEWVTYVACGGL
jgi:hypothetical protein